MKFSVLMAVYGGDNPVYLGASLQSLADQRLAADELVLVEDGRLTDELRSVIDRYRPVLPLKSVRIPDNRGLANALNEGLNYCTNSLVARMDSDDICMRDRFEKQIQYFRSQPETDVCSAWVEECDEAMDRVLNIRKIPSGHEEIVAFAASRNPINHSACMFRKQAVVESGGYPEIYPEDYPLWCNMIVRGYRFANIPEVLVQMRTGKAFYSRRDWRFLKGEISILKYQYSIGQISGFRAFSNGVVRSVIRLSPGFAKKLFYRYLR